MTTLMDLDAGALEVIATLIDDPPSVVRLAATCRDLRRMLLGHDDAVGWRSVSAFIGATDTAGVPWLPRGEATAERPLPRAPSQRAAALAFSPAVRDTHGAAVARALSKLRCALHAASPRLAATLCQGADEDALEVARDAGWGSAALTYATLCNGQTASTRAAFNPFTELTGSLFGAEIYGDVCAGRLLPLARVGAPTVLAEPWLAGNPPTVNVVVSEMLVAAGRPPHPVGIESERVLVVDAVAPDAPVEQTVLRRVAARARATPRARARPPAWPPGWPHLRTTSRPAAGWWWRGRPPGCARSRRLCGAPCRPTRRPASTPLPWATPRSRAACT